MEEQFLSLTKAQKYTGLSRGKLRRFVESITKPDNHSDRHFIQPSVNEVEELHRNKHPFSWKVSVELLDREFSKEGSVGSQNPNTKALTPEIKLLEKTIDLLKAEIDEKNTQISKFQERDRETNILLKQTTEKLVMLNEGTRQTVSGDALTVDLRHEEGSEPVANAAQSDPPTLWELVRTPFRFRKKRNQ